MKRTVGGSEVAQWVKVFVNPQDRSEPQTETQTDTETDRYTKWRGGDSERIGRGTGRTSRWSASSFFCIQFETPIHGMMVLSNSG